MQVLQQEQLTTTQQQHYQQHPQEQVIPSLVGILKLMVQGLLLQQAQPLQQISQFMLSG